MPSVLFSEVQSESRKWSLSTKVYGTVNVLVRVFLIVASSIVGAEKTIAPSRIGGLAQWVPAFALAVTIVTALDTWLKPREKWRGFMVDRDDIADLTIRISAAQDKGADMEELREEFSKLRRRHREKNVY